MLVVCKNCNASYAVPITKIGPTSREVRCAKCSATFFVEPNQEAYNAAIDLERLAGEIQNKNQGHYLGFNSSDEEYIEELEESNSIFASKFLSLILLILLCGLSMVIFYNRLITYPQLASLYEKVGIHSTQNISLDKITTQNVIDDENENLQISGDIVNNKNFKAFVPNLRISVQDYAGKELLGYTMEIKNEILLPNEKYNFSNIITNISPYAATITIEIGNQVEFLLR